PSDGLSLQSSNPGAHSKPPSGGLMMPPSSGVIPPSREKPPSSGMPPRQLPMTQSCPVAHWFPHAPQCSRLERTFVSHPSDGSSLQSPNPVAHSRPPSGGGESSVPMGPSSLVGDESDPLLASLYSTSDHVNGAPGAVREPWTMRFASLSMPQ